MATVTNLTQYFTNGAIEAFTDLVAPLTSFAYAVNQTGAVLNDIVRVPYVANASASSAFTYAAGYSGTSNGVTGKSVTLNTLLYQPIALTDAELQQISPEVATRLGGQAGQRLAADFLSASFASVITNANFPKSASYAAASFTSSVAVADVDKQANDNKWAEGNRFIVAGTTLWQSLMNNTNFTNAYAFGSAAAVQSGKLPQIFGFNPYKTTVTLPNSCTGFAASSNACAVAMAYHVPGPESKNIITATQMVDTKTGITLGYREWYDPNYATTRRIIDVLGGVAVVDSYSLLQIK